MKKILLTTLCTVAVTSHNNAMLKNPVDNDNFHGKLLNNQIQNMINNDRADELKLWLDQASSQCPLTIPHIATLQAYATSTNSQKSADVLLTFMMKSGL